MRGWKATLQRLADDLRLCIHVPHFPPGTSKWNKVEHRLFCHITQNWRGRPLRTFETLVVNCDRGQRDHSIKIRGLTMTPFSVSRLLDA